MSLQRFRFEYIRVPDWPVLAWLARCHPGTDVITVFHGGKVETTDEWFCEATWDGTFEAGDFDQTDIVAGSGGRARGSELVFVSSASTVDRLHSMQTSDGCWVSNSLSCLIVAADAEIDETSSRYFWLFRTVVKGIRRYRRLFPTSAGPIALTYFDNLVWNGRELISRDKPGLGKDFTSFGAYYDFLQRSMQALANNAGAPQRRSTFELLSTASSGYDSSTVTVLAKGAGATRVLCFDQGRAGIHDSGAPLARALGLTPISVPRNAWMSSSLPEVPFIASDSHGGDVFFKGAEDVLANKLLLTGYHGDKIWAKHVHTVVDENIVRGDQSGLSLAEYRLTIGTIHCPVSFWGVRQMKDVHAISNSPEMVPWDVPGHYSRPVCRRIVETAGVPRELFGIEKKATWVLLQWGKDFLLPASKQNYVDWLRDRRGKWLRRGRIPPVINDRVDSLEIGLKTSIARAANNPDAWYRTPLVRSGLIRVAGRLTEGPSRLRQYVFPWALEHHRRAYTRPPSS